MSAHTAGPWEACGNYVRQARSHSAGQEVARIDFSASHFDAETRAANTMLIAAAPSLLEALREVLPWAEGNHDGDKTCDCDRCEVVRAARAAIAKAEGWAP